ncbi:hypothetical protein L204_105206 [Cryptococcus depauperatus]|nr:hypothetical protein L204_03857 [Cryptococcus depauperatus CBS 7855]
MVTPVSFTVRPPGYKQPPQVRDNRGPPSRRLFEDHGDEDDDEEHLIQRDERPIDEKIEGFGNGKILGGDKKQAPMIIPVLPNVDWRKSSERRAPLYRPDSRTTSEVIETHERIGDGFQQSGLRKTAIRSEAPVNGTDGNVQVKTEYAENNISSVGNVQIKQEIDSFEIKKEPLTLDEQALQAILAGETSTKTEDCLNSELAINTATIPLSEEEALKRDMVALPEESSLEDYAAVPVSAFGEAMARGMGWTPQSQGTKVHEPKLRPALLGLGATALQNPVPPSRLGSSKKNRGPGKKERMKYNLGGVMVRREDSGTPGGTMSQSEPVRMDNTESSGKRRRNDGYEMETKKRDDRYRERDRYPDIDREKAKYKEKEYEIEERARRKAKERERRDRHDDKVRDGYSDRACGR